MVSIGNSKSLSLFRSLMREAKQMNDYNFRSYAQRRIKHGFRVNASLQTQEERENATQVGQEQLQMLTRQRLIGNLYPSDTSVMESSTM